MISAPDTLRGIYSAARAIGEKSINSDATMEIDGFTGLMLLTKQFPWPVMGSQGEIEVAGPLGVPWAQPQNVRVWHQGPVTFTETKSGMVGQFLTEVITRQGGVFQATVYEGTPESFSYGLRLVDCFFVPDGVDRDWENRAQMTMVNGTLHYHHFGQRIPGNAV
jgi:hypothetical protein